MIFAVYLALCALLCFLPVEAYAARLFPAPASLQSRGAVWVWKPWLECLIGVVFFAKGFLLALAGSVFLANEPNALLFTFLGFLLAILAEACSPLKKNRRILALGLGFLSIYQLAAALIYGLIFFLLLIFVHYRVPAMVAAAGLYALVLIPQENSYQLAAALVLFIALCTYYLTQLRAYFDGQAKTILEEFKKP